MYRIVEGRTQFVVDKQVRELAREGWTPAGPREVREYPYGTLVMQLLEHDGRTDAERAALREEKLTLQTHVHSASWRDK